MRVILLIGFGDEKVELEKGIENILPEAKLFAVPCELGSEVVEKIIETAGNGMKGGKGCWERRFVIMHGLTGKEISRIMKFVKSISREVIFAATTDTSLKWRLDHLLRELEEEDAYFKKMKRVT